MRAGEIDRTVSPWVYEPARHKTSYRGGSRRVMIGAAAQQLLGPLLEKLKPEEVVFSPRRAKAERYAARYGEGSAPKPKSKGKRHRRSGIKRASAGEYSPASYGAAIRAACDAAGIPRWHPNQLRHAFGSEARDRFGLEAAQVLLGHTKCGVTQVYAQRDMGLAAKTAEKMG